MNIKTILTLSILFVASPRALLSASGPLLENRRVFAANTGNVGHLYEGGIPGYPYFGGYPNYGGYPYITGYGYPYNGDHSYDYGYGHPYNGDHSLLTTEATPSFTITTITTITTPTNVKI